VGIPTATAGPGPETEAEPKGSKISHRGNKILWVDDKPESNAFEIAQLRSLGLEVDLARSTAEGMRKFEQAARSYDLVLSDIGRTEDGQYERKAGLELLKQIRSAQSDVPVLFFTTSRTAELKPIREAVESDKYARVTGSTTELFDMIHEALAKKS
jgi:CheY-like chemotaxis protein